MSCYYTLSNLKDEIFLIDAEGSVTRYTVGNVEVSSESSLNNRYAFQKEISFVLPGYTKLSLIDKQIAFALNTGETFLWNREFAFTEHYVFTLDEQLNRIQYQLEIDENVDFLPYEISSYEDAESSSTCEYSVAGKPTLEVIKFHEAVLDEENDTLLTGSTLIEFDGVVTLREEYDSQYYQKTVTCSMPLDSENQELNDTLKEFLLNKYIAVIKGQDLHFIAGLELGLIVNSTIASDDNGSRIELTFQVDENVPLFASESLSYATMEPSIFLPVKFAHNGEIGYECDGDGTAYYVLKREFLYDGTGTENYKALEDYYLPDTHLNIVGTFDDIITFECPECIISDTLELSTSKIDFSESGQTATFTVYSQRSSWSATSVPSFITLSPTSGANRTTSVTATCISGTDAFGFINIANAKNEGKIALQLKVPKIYVNPEQINAAAQNVFVTAVTDGLEFDRAEVQVGMLSTSIRVIVEQINDRNWKITISKNPNTSTARTIKLYFRHNNGIYLVNVNQERLYRRYEELRQICENGELISLRQVFESYDNENFFNTGDIIRVQIGTC